MDMVMNEETMSLSAALSTMRQLTWYHRIMANPAHVVTNLGVHDKDSSTWVQAPPAA